ncbi:MAG: hypothetical protein AABY22_17350, partial [Nanoarchaeota archaeon]
MCRILAAPPSFKRKEAIRILDDFSPVNSDGTGYVYLENGEFKGDKWPKPLSYVLKKKSSFL